MEANLNIGIAFAAGVLSFLSPCVLPLIPAYLSLMGGTTLEEMTGNRAIRRRAFFNTVFFVVGFSVVFIVLGILFTSTFVLLGGAARIINVVAGVVVIILGLNFVFDFWKTLNFEKRFHLSGRPTNAPTSLLFGMAFGAGWSPCIGPILSTILFLAGSGGSVLRGVFLLVVYSLGLGLPFLLTGLFLPRAMRQLNRIKRHIVAIKIGSGIFLVLIGVLIAVGRLQQFNVSLFSFAYRIESWEATSPGAARAVFSGVFFAFAALVAAFYVRRVMIERSRGGEVAIEATGGEGVRIHPVRAVFLLVFIVAGVLSLTGVLNFSQLLSFWFSYQGI